MSTTHGPVSKTHWVILTLSNTQVVEYYSLITTHGDVTYSHCVLLNVMQRYDNEAKMHKIVDK